VRLHEETNLERLVKGIGMSGRRMWGEVLPSKRSTKKRKSNPCFGTRQERQTIALQKGSSIEKRKELG